MSKYKYLLLTFLLVSLATSKLEMNGQDNDSGGGIHFRCGGKSVKTSNLCGYQTIETLNNKGKLSETKFFYIFSKCKGNEICVKVGTNEDETDFKCAARIEKREHGESCVYDTDCLSSSCKDKKCVAIPDDNECEKDLHFQCKPGSYCERQEDGKDKCKKMAKKDENCKGGNAMECRLGLTCYQEKCTEYGSLKIGTVLGQYDDPLLCESGMAETVKNNDGKNERQCVEVETECVCPQHKEGKCTTKFKNLNFLLEDRPCEGYSSVEGKKVYVPPYMKYTTTAFKDFMDDLKGIKPYEDDFYKGEKYIGERKGFNNYKTAVKYYKYEMGKRLIGQKMIDDKGKVINSCEFEFFLKYISSGFTKYNILNSILLFVGLLL